MTHKAEREDRETRYVRESLELLVWNQHLANLGPMSAQELHESSTLTPSDACRLKASMELGRRTLIGCAMEQLTQVRSAGDVAKLLEPQLRGLQQEELWVVVLSTRNHILKKVQVYKGSLNSSIVRPAEVFAEAIKLHGAAIIVAHNHPSGDPNPSPDDIRVTKDLVAAGNTLDIELLDHLVIGDARHGYVSLRERKLGFS
jgi:DNA repair protein RadC